MKIFIFIVTLLIVAMCFLYRYMKSKIINNSPRYLGEIIGVEPTRLPWMIQYLVRVRLHGKQEFAVSVPYKKKKQFRIGAKVPVVMKSMPTGVVNQNIVYIMQKVS